MEKKIKMKRFKTDYPEYHVWYQMLRRCYIRSHQEYHNYGGRGISVCERWRIGEHGKSGWECFLEDMGERPSDNHTLERIDNNFHYIPGNCMWETIQKQQWNKRTARRFLGMTVPELAVFENVSQQVIRHRFVRHGHPFSRDCLQ